MRATAAQRHGAAAPRCARLLQRLRAGASAGTWLVEACCSNFPLASSWKAKVGTLCRSYTFVAQQASMRAPAHTRTISGMHRSSPAQMMRMPRSVTTLASLQEQGGKQGLCRHVVVQSHARGVCVLPKQYSATPQSVDRDLGKRHPCK